MVGGATLGYVAAIKRSFGPVRVSIVRYSPLPPPSMFAAVRRAAPKTRDSIKHRAPQPGYPQSRDISDRLMSENHRIHSLTSENGRVFDL
jgi:hypothetical protein